MVTMPRMKRHIRNDYRAAGFAERQGKGDHTVFSYPGLSKHFAVDGSDGSDAKPYDEHDLREALRAQAEVQRKGEA
jgi:hypothetical protein